MKSVVAQLYRLGRHRPDAANVAARVAARRKAEAEARVTVQAESVHEAGVAL